MPKYPPQIAWLFMVNLLLSACGTIESPHRRFSVCLEPPSEHTALCRELQNQLIMSGATSNDRIAEIQNANQYMIARSYDINCQNCPRPVIYPLPCD